MDDVGRRVRSIHVTYSHFGPSFVSLHIHTNEMVTEIFDDCRLSISYCRKHTLLKQAQARNLAATARSPSPEYWAALH